MTESIKQMPGYIKALAIIVGFIVTMAFAHAQILQNKKDIAELKDDQKSIKSSVGDLKTDVAVILAIVERVEKKLDK